MAKHSSFKNIVAYETYQRFFATVRAQKLAHENRDWELAGAPMTLADWQAKLQPEAANAEPPLPFISIERMPPNSPEAESWIESWLAGKTDGSTV